MQHRTKRLLGIGAVVVLVAGIGTGVAVAAGDDGPEDEGADTPITGSALDRARDAALEFTGGGTVTGTEVGDEESLYEVEVTLNDGSQVDVQLDAGFDVVGSEGEAGPDDD